MKAIALGNKEEEGPEERMIMRRCQTLGTMVRTLVKEMSRWFHQNPRSPSTNSSLSLPLLHDLDFELASISSRLFIFFSSSDREDHSRIFFDSKKLEIQISLDSEKLMA